MTIIFTHVICIYVCPSVCPNFDSQATITAGRIGRAGRVDHWWLLYRIVDPPGHGRIGGHYFRAWCPYVRHKKQKRATTLTSRSGKQNNGHMHENNDHLFAGAWWVTLKSHDLFYLNLNINDFVYRWEGCEVDWNGDYPYVWLQCHTKEIKLKSVLKFKPDLHIRVIFGY